MIPVKVSGQQASETRILNRSFPVKGEMSLEVTNKYGKVHLAPASVDSVSIRIEMIANASSTSKLRKLIDGVSFELNSTNYFIIAETRFGKGPANLFESIRSITNNLLSSESRLEINYYIEVPSMVKVKVDNRYGDVYIESMDCDLNISMSNGNLKGEELTGDNYFELDFFDATINSLASARLNLGYGEISIIKATDLNISSSSSRIDIAGVTSLSCNSKRDKYFIDEIESIAGESYFTDFNIGTLATSASLGTKYGSFNLTRLMPHFELFSLSSDFTSVTVNTDRESSFNIDIKVVNCPTSMPAEWDIEEKIISEERKEYLYFGKKGSSGNNSQMKLSLSRGRLVLN